MRAKEFIKESRSLYSYWFDPKTGKVFDDGSSHAYIAFKHWKEMGLTKQPTGMSYIEDDVMANGWIRSKTYSDINGYEGNSLLGLRKALKHSMEVGEIKENTICRIDLVELELFKMKHRDRAHYDTINEKRYELTGWEQAENFIKGRIS